MANENRAFLVQSRVLHDIRNKIGFSILSISFDKHRIRSSPGVRPWRNFQTCMPTVEITEPDPPIKNSHQNNHLKRRSAQKAPIQKAARAKRTTVLTFEKFIYKQM